MLIRIKQSRQRKDPVTGGIRYGTDVEFGHKSKGNHRVYRFRPRDPKRPEEDHVCDIESAEDIGTLLAIKEGYEVHPSEVKSRVAKPVAAEQPPAPPKPEATGGDQGPKNYQSLKKPDLLKLVASRTGKQPHGTTAVAKLIETLEALDRA